MQYEFRVWNDPQRMPNIEAHEAEGRLEALKSAAKNALGQNDHGNPNILIDADGSGEDAIKSADISYFLQEVKMSKNRTYSARAIRMKIHGNLYLPLDGSLADTAKSMAGLSVGDENVKRDTLLLSQWANCLPPVGNQESPGYYRAVALSVLTKAGDFRVITAKKVYVESYSENYEEGEFGTFELTLAQRIDADDNFVVDGLSSEKQGVLDQIKGALNSKAVKKFTEAAEKVAMAGAVVKVGSAVVKKGVETYEKFHGETEFTKKFKQGLDTAGSAGDITGNAANIAKSIKNDKGMDRIKNISDEISKANDTINDDVQKGKDAYGGTISLADLEANYLAIIKKNPDAYKKYLEASYEDKRKMLEEYAQKGLERANITKYYEESQIDLDKVKQIEKELSEGKFDSEVDGEPIDNPTPSSTPNPTPTPIPIPTDKLTTPTMSNKPSANVAGLNLNSGGLSSQISSAALKKTNGGGDDSK